MQGEKRWLNASLSTEQQEGGTSRRTIILVEDDLSNAEVLDLLLQAENEYQLTRFRTGGEMLANVDRVKSLNPLLFVLDYQLPSMNGLDLYERLHAIEGLEKVPALMLSGSRIRDVERARMSQLGLILVPKPYDIDDVLATIKQVIT